jgi:ketosteroid isomerase-like protein
MSFERLLGRRPARTATGEDMVRMGEALAGAVTDDFECVMIDPFREQTYHGAEGFSEAWRDWLQPYSSFVVHTDEMIEREDMWIYLVRQRAVTRHDGVEIENPSASIWRFRDGRLARVEFYLERAAGVAAAGL